MKLLPSLASVALTYEQPKYDDFLRTLEQKKGGWGAPTGRIAALWSLCPPLITPTNGQVVCDQATCALVCDPGFIPVGKRRTKCRWNQTDSFFWKKQLSICETCETELAAPPAGVTVTCDLNSMNKKKCTYQCENGEELQTSSGNFKQFSAVCACPRWNGRVCGWNARKLGGMIIDADIATLSCPAAPTTTSIPATSTSSSSATTSAATTSTAAASAVTTTTFLPATKFSSFNIQVFGTTKYGKEPVKNQIVEILQRYDIATIQEIRDISETAFPSLVNDINAAVDKYDWFTGERQGTTSSKEQVGFIWDRNMFSKVDGYDFNDTATAWFERPPTVLVLERSSPNALDFQTQKVGIISAHLKPESGVTNMVTENEINHLKDVEDDLRSRHPTLDDVIIAGDFNADCDYVRDPQDLTLFSSGNNTWLISFDDDTTVKSTVCAYDHIVLSGQIENNFVAGSGQVFDYQTFYNTDSIFFNGDPITELVSDHFPVEFEFY